MRAIGVDVGKNAPAHCLLEPLLWSALPIATDPAVPVFVEGQYPNNKASRQSLMTLSYFAGLQAGYYLARGHSVYVLKPDKWKPLIVPRSSRMNKQVMQNHARRGGLVPDKVWSESEDVIDAYLIAKAGLKLLQSNKLPKEEKWTK